MAKRNEVVLDRQSLQAKLYAACVAWRDRVKPLSPESIYQRDDVQEELFDLAERVCEVIGYSYPEDEYKVPDVKPGDRRLFRTPYEQYAERHDQVCVIEKVIDTADETHDEEVLPMYSVRFESDGEVIEAWPEEIQEAAC